MHEARSRTKGSIMEIGIIILLALATGIGVFFGIRAIYRAHQAKVHTASQAKTLKWVTGVENATTDKDIADYGDLYTSSYYFGQHPLDDNNRQKAAEQKHDAAKRRVASHKISQELGKNPAPYDIADACLQVHICKLYPQLALNIDGSELGTLFVDTMKATLDLVRQGDLVAMNGYVGVMSRTSNGQDLCAKYDVAMPTYPADWDDMVVEFIASPSAKDFKNTPELSVGEVRSLAPIALAENDFKTAKLVLAYCLEERIEEGESVHGRYGLRVGGGKSRQVIFPFREAIGDVLLADLLKMVEHISRATASASVRLQELR